MPYGATNLTGVPTDKVLRELLRQACNADISLIDTAPAYGNSEIVLGRLRAGENFDFITKTLTRGAMPDVATMVTEFHRSLRRLRKPAIKGLLFHDAEILTSTAGTALFDGARQLKDDGLVQKLGVSVYSTKQIDAVLGKFDVDMVQLPINLFDQRLLVSGALNRLKDRGVEIHARSAFLQGVMLSTPEQLPRKVAMFSPFINKFRERISELKLSPVEACLGFLLSIEAIDHIVVGVTSALELAEVLLALESTVQSDTFSDLAIDNPYLVDPRFWR